MKLESFSEVLRDDRDGSLTLVGVIDGKEGQLVIGPNVAATLPLVLLSMPQPQSGQTIALSTTNIRGLSFATSADAVVLELLLPGGYMVPLKIQKQHFPMIREICQRALAHFGIDGSAPSA